MYLQYNYEFIMKAGNTYILLNLQRWWIHKHKEKLGNCEVIIPKTRCMNFFICTSDGDKMTPNFLNIHDFAIVTLELSSQCVFSFICHLASKANFYHTFQPLNTWWSQFADSHLLDYTFIYLIIKGEL